MVDGPLRIDIGMTNREVLNPQRDPTVDASRIIRHSVAYAAGQAARPSTEKEAQVYMESLGLTKEQSYGFGWIGTLDFLTKQDEFIGNVDIQAREDQKESDNDTFIRTWQEGDDTHAEVSIRGAEMPEGSSNLRVTHIIGRKDGQFHCMIAGKAEPITVPEHILTTSFICAQSESVKANMGPSQRKVFETYLRQIKKPSEVVDFDQQTLKEAALESGQITTDSILSFLESKYPKKNLPQPPAGDAPEDVRKAFIDESTAVTQHNTVVEQKIGSFRSELSDHVIASRGDLVGLMRIYGPDAVNESKLALAELKNNEEYLRRQFAQLRGTSEEATIEIELSDLRTEISTMEKALESYKNPEEAAKVLLWAQEGSLPPSLAKSISFFLGQGKMNEAVTAAIQEQINSLPDDSAEKVQMEKRKQIAIMASGGALLLLFMLITQGMNDNK